MEMKKRISLELRNRSPTERLISFFESCHRGGPGARREARSPLESPWIPPRADALAHFSCGGGGASREPSLARS
ncbi:hypothetical protein CRENBAI_011663 [Crenichthys baileyi]|uniref:Uncharacterized protein n=1 Tax=Crenichthys baileyi TaxID=28760 RepID=A0AAV9SBH3_9TELE